MKMLVAVLLALALGLVSADKPHKYLMESALDMEERAVTVHHCMGVGLYSCASGQCIQQEWVCDMETDCIDGSDESANCSTNCTGQNQFRCDANQCISIEFRCDGQDDCNNGLDEQDCHLMQCTVGETKCANELCVETMWVCDGEDDCHDGSDERNCTSCQHGYFLCAGAAVCIANSQVCNGHFDCADHSDETDCVHRPPNIVVQPSKVVFYKALETARLPCEAHGFPRPVYEWTRNGILFNPGGNDDRVMQLPDVGTLVFTRPEDKDEGVYQCRATNRYGVSLSVYIAFREARLWDFGVERDRTYRPMLGTPLTLNCIPPMSIPQAGVYWVIKTPNGGLEPVHFGARVTMDHEYRLRFTNVERGDGRGGRAYVCMATNSVVRRTVQARQNFIQPQGGTPQLRPADYMWASPEGDFGLLGERFAMKCIFSGNPTPDVHWERTNGSSLPPRAKIQSFGQELLIEDLQFEDAGSYSCWATNNVTQSRVQRTITVRVESPPHWLHEPQDVDIAVGGTAEFNCLARAVPEPQYYWYVNGVPLAEVTDPRISPARFQRPQPDRVVFSDLTRNDFMVIQCNATNKHGYIWGDVFLRVH